MFRHCKLLAIKFNCDSWMVTGYDKSGDSRWADGIEKKKLQAAPRTSLILATSFVAKNRSRLQPAFVI
jgi:hypothetical protein